MLIGDGLAFKGGLNLQEKANFFLLIDEIKVFMSQNCKSKLSRYKNYSDTDTDFCLNLKLHTS